MIRILCLFILCLLALASIAFALCNGSTLIGLNQWIALASGHSTLLTHQVIFELRLPRALCAFVTGGLLALAGALMQVLLRNPLADPYVLGVSSGAAIATLGGLLMGLSGLWLTGIAWAGSLAAILLVFALAGTRSPARLLLTGVALASGLSALMSFILLISPDHELRHMLFWLLGDLSYARVPSLESIILVCGLLFSFSIAKELNLLAQGNIEAQTRGVNTGRLQLQLYFLSALLTATAVTLAGCIGFIGLIVPHCFRFLFGFDHRYLLPGSVLLGGTLLTLADTLSRTVLAPQQIPVGILTALIGVPLFLLLLRKNPSC